MALRLYTSELVRQLDPKTFSTQSSVLVRWAQSVQQMVADGATHFVECGPGKVLQGLVKEIERTAEVSRVE